MADNLSDYNIMKSKIYVRLYSSDMGIEFPHIMIADDLAAVCYMDLDDGPNSGEYMTANVTNTTLNAWGISFETVLDDARENMESVCEYRSLDAMMKEIMDKWII